MTFILLLLKKQRLKVFELSESNDEINRLNEFLLSFDGPLSIEIQMPKKVEGARLLELIQQMNDQGINYIFGPELEENKITVFEI